MFETNRGEIAQRIMQSCDRLGISTVAIYSDADRDAAHVAMATEAVRVGPPPSAESYLQIDTVVDACLKTGAQAVHPGYGFLSENAQFALALEAAGIVFIGPGVHAIEVMGDKIRSKQLAENSSVNVIPGFTDVVRDADHAIEISRDIGYPVMLKASAGGGGKGMRVAFDDAECREGFERATSEARSSFGDDRIFIEKFIHLCERECSIQRRHQKIIEEAPSPFVTPEMRAEMGAQALGLARAVDYKSAGTVEFIVAEDRSFYFLEMNTRLQVEHPVTEMVTGIDLVEEMIRIANGDALTKTQADITLNGWAIESRVYAEDPVRGFLPSTGRIMRYREPLLQGARVDSGVVEGAEISMYYDPMIAKLVTHGKDRGSAISAMATALDEYFIEGVSTNISFLRRIMAHPRFVDGRLSTDFIADEYPDGVIEAQADAPTLRVFSAVAMAATAIEQRRAAQISGQLRADARVSDNDVALVCTFSDYGDEFRARVEFRNGQWIVVYDHGEIEVATDWWPGQAQFRARIDGEGVPASPVNVVLKRTPTGFELRNSGIAASCTVLAPRVAELSRHMIEKPAPDMSRFLVSPMPGLLIRVSVETGESVKAGQELAVVEAMKMENVLTAERDVVVDEVLAEAGSSLTVDQPILSFR